MALNVSSSSCNMWKYSSGQSGDEEIEHWTRPHWAAFALGTAGQSFNSWSGVKHSHPGFIHFVTFTGKCPMWAVML